MADGRCPSCLHELPRDSEIELPEPCGGIPSPEGAAASKPLPPVIASVPASSVITTPVSQNQVDVSAHSNHLTTNESPKTEAPLQPRKVSIHQGDMKICSRCDVLNDGSAKVCACGSSLFRPYTVLEQQADAERKRRLDATKSAALGPGDAVAASSTPPAGKSFAGELLGVVALFLVVFGFFILRDMSNPSGKANYDKVQVGLSLAEVEKILGTRLSIPDSDRAHFSGSGKWWAVDYVSAVGPLGNKAMKEINVEFRDGVVVRKSRSEH